MFRILFTGFIAALLVGCATTSPSPKTPSHGRKKEENLPAWVSRPDAPGVIRAVGSAPRNFQGVHMQRTQALADARDKLAHKIRVEITAEYETQLKAQGKHLTQEMNRRITEVSQLLLQNSRQVDGYIGRRGRLYVLVEAPSPRGGRTGAAPLPALETIPFDPAVLKKSRCHPPSVLKEVKTKYGLYLGKPVWFFRPDYGGHIGAVGVAEKESGMSFDAQKRVALSLARADLSRRKKMQMDSNHALLRILKHDVVGGTLEKELRTSSTSKLTGTKLEDLWLDPKSCELYVWVVEK
jgi:hypothetical protein